MLRKDSVIFLSDKFIFIVNQQDVQFISLSWSWKNIISALIFLFYRMVYSWLIAMQLKRNILSIQNTVVLLFYQAGNSEYDHNDGGY